MGIESTMSAALQRLTCPVCLGSGRVPIGTLNIADQGFAKSQGWHGYRAVDDTINCCNCGAQYMFGKPTGLVRARRDGTACLHEYRGREVGRCLTLFTCRHCGDTHTVDSGD
jgi:hypothetical protein